VNAAATRRLISILRSHPLPKRRLPLPIAREEALARDYAAAIVRHAGPLRAVVAKVLPRILVELEARRRELGRTDADTPGDKRRGRQIRDLLATAGPAARRALALLEQAASAVVDAFDPAALKKLTERFGETLTYQQRLAFDQVIRTAIGVPLSLIEGAVRVRLEEWAAANVDLIRSLSSRYFDRLRLRTLEAFETGDHPNDLADEFERVYGMSERQANVIARDQLGKLNGEVNQARQEALGVTHYIWRTMRDNRVRDEHFALEGQRVAWDDPPPVGPNGEPAHPGEAIQCRCYAEPDLSDLLKD